MRKREGRGERDRDTGTLKERKKERVKKTEGRGERDRDTGTLGHLRKKRNRE